MVDEDSATVDSAVQSIRAGNPVVVADGRDREDEGDLIMSAAMMTREHMAFFLRHGSGIVCVPMSEAVADRLELPPMVSDNTDAHGTAFTVSVDALDVRTGISAGERAATVNALADPHTMPQTLRRPGHIFPLRGRHGGVLKRAGHTEAALDLLEMAGAREVAVITELVDDAGNPLHGDDIATFAAHHGLAATTIDDLVRVRRRKGGLIRRAGVAQLPLRQGMFSAFSYRSQLDDIEHLALVLGDIDMSNRADGVLVRVHSECLTGDIFGSLRCDCGDQLTESLDIISENGNGIVVYLRGQEGRGIGLGHKLRAYALQDDGADTVDANLALGLPVDSRDYGIGAAILSDLGVSRIRLLTNNPHKYTGLTGHDLTLVQRVPLPPRITAQNLAYLRTKRDRMGHVLTLPDTGSVPASSTG